MICFVLIPRWWIVGSLHGGTALKPCAVHPSVHGALGPVQAWQGIGWGGFHTHSRQASPNAHVVGCWYHCAACGEAILH